MKNCFDGCSYKSQEKDGVVICEWLEKVVKGVRDCNYFKKYEVIEEFPTEASKYIEIGNTPLVVDMFYNEADKCFVRVEK
jgi:hypothetical protein